MGIAAEATEDVAGVVGIVDVVVDDALLVIFGWSCYDSCSGVMVMRATKGSKQAERKTQDPWVRN